MAGTVYQCCYTNATAGADGVTSSGWQALAVTPGMPRDAYDACVRLQVERSSITGAMVDEAGEVLNLLEVGSDDGYVYALRSQYGLQGTAGRASMFSQAFVLPWGDGALADPWRFIGIERECYHASAQEAAGAAERLRLLPQPSLAEALREAGIENDAYLGLMRSVLARLLDIKGFGPLYVAFDGSERQLRATLLCIYLGLPLYLRKRVTVASCPTATDTTPQHKRLVFSVGATSKASFVVPQTGESNNVTKRALGRMAHLGYLDYLPRHVGEKGIERHYERLARMAMLLGDDGASNPDVLRIAHRILVGTDFAALDDDDLREDASDALMVSWNGSEHLRQHATKLLELVVERGIVLSEASERDLNGHVAESADSAFAQAAENYVIDRFATMPTDDAARSLGRMDEVSFRRYEWRLVQSERGCDILDRYYAGRVQQAAREGWDALVAVAAGSEQLVTRPKTIAALDTAASAHYDASIGDAPAAAASLGAYLSLMERLLGADELRRAERGAKESFWAQMSLGRFDPDHRSHYDLLYVDCEMANDCIALDDLLHLLDEGEAAFLRDAHPWLLLHDGDGDGDALSVLCRWATALYRGSDQDLAGWIEVLSHVTGDPLLSQVILLRSALLRSDALRSSTIIVEIGNGGDDGHDDAFGKALLDAAMPHLMRMDALRPIKLDVWLSLGRLMDARQPFAVFDVVQPAILGMRSADVVAESTLLAPQAPHGSHGLSPAQDYSLAADSYVRGRGQQAKTVRQWMRELRGGSGDRGVVGGFATLAGNVLGRGDRLPRDARHKDDGAEKRRGGGIFGGLGR